MSLVSRSTRVSTPPRYPPVLKRTKYARAKSTSGSKALSKVRRQKNNNIVAFPYRQPFPSQLVTTLRYVQYAVIQTNASGYGTYTMSANSLYDPDALGGGHQPMYFDQLMAVYNHYTVLKSNCVAQMNSSTSMNYPVTLTMFLDDDTNPSLSSAIDGQERIGAVTKMFNPQYDGINAFQVKKYWSSGFTFPGDALARDELQGTVSTSPSEQSYFVILFDGQLSTLSTAIQIRVEMEFTAVFDEWKSMSGS